MAFLDRERERVLSDSSQTQSLSSTHRYTCPPTMNRSGSAQQGSAQKLRDVPLRLTFTSLSTGEPPPTTHLNPTTYPSPRDTNRNWQTFARTTPGKDYPLVSALILVAPGMRSLTQTAPSPTVCYRFGKSVFPESVTLPCHKKRSGITNTLLLDRSGHCFANLSTVIAFEGSLNKRSDN